ncbi:MAG TPA: pyridoxal-dependent decarboxylase [Candidatus Kryptonia bacterium]
MNDIMNNLTNILSDEPSLDPENWDEMKQLGHQMLDDMFNCLREIRSEPSWREIPEKTKRFLRSEIPIKPQKSSDVYREFKEHILPYPSGNIHPRFWAWVQGTGTPFGVLAEMLAATMDSNTAIGEHSAMYVEAQVINWCKQMLNYPANSSGILVSGGSMANITALIVARNHQTGKDIRQHGVKAAGGLMTIYYSTETHSCVDKAVEVMGIGRDAIRKIDVDKNFQIRTDKLVETIESDIAKGNTPFCVVGNAGTVNTGAIDALGDLLDISRKFGLWFHVDGAFGALAKLVPEYAGQLKPIEEADSVAFDLHKWMYMPYEVGCVLVKDAKAHRNAFAVDANYLLNHERGLAAGPDPMGNYGLELSRGFKALKVWMSLKEHGLERYAAAIRKNIAQAFYLGELIAKEKTLELLAPVSMNIVCYRYTGGESAHTDLNELNKNIVMELQERGIASPSSTMIGTKYAIRVAITNHRSRKEDFELLVKETIKIGNELSS